ncbi:MAG: L,D-transpeptidase family protein [Gammaproteobacteria bacterium]
MLKRTSAALPHAGAALPCLLLAIGLLSGCQLEPITINFLEYPPPTATFPPDEVGEQQPKLADIATRKFLIAKDRSIVGGLAVISAHDGDTLSDIARHFGLGYTDITRANPRISPWAPQVGARVLLPLQFILPDTPRKGIVLNLANMRMFYYPPKQPSALFTYPLGIGREGWNTPLGQTTIVAKKANPAWAPPESIRREHAAKGAPLPAVVPPGPDNPLGKYALYLGFNRYLIHGTNKPYGVGMQVSHGCVRLYPEDIKALFKKTSVGMPVRIVHQPYLAAWDGNMLYLEAHEPLQKWAGQKKRQLKSLLKQLRQTAAKKGATVDWEKVDRILQRTDGIPTPILAASPDLPELVAKAPELQHPGYFYGQPVIAELTGRDWAILVADFNDAAIAQQLAAMLNHQGPPIPARKVEKNGSYQVIAGPFKNQKEAKLVAHRIKTDFEMDTKLLQPGDGGRAPAHSYQTSKK